MLQKHIQNSEINLYEFKKSANSVQMKIKVFRLFIKLFQSICWNLFDIVIMHSQCYLDHFPYGWLLFFICVNSRSTEILIDSDLWGGIYTLYILNYAPLGGYIVTFPAKSEMQRVCRIHPNGIKIWKKSIIRKVARTLILNINNSKKLFTNKWKKLFNKELATKFFFNQN